MVENKMVFYETKIKEFKELYDLLIFLGKKEEEAKNIVFEAVQNNYTITGNYSNQ